MRNTLKKISAYVPSPWGRARVGVLFLLLPFTFYAQTNTFPASGNAGIGTTNPQGGLHIKDENGLLIETSGFPARIRMTDGFTNTNTKDDLLFESDGAFLFKLDQNGNGISNIPGFGIFDKDNKIIFFARDNGNVGIGTVTPDAKFTVKGKIHTQEVKVDLAGAVAPDYVFKEDYHLRSLEEVQAHIKEKGHLPGIPSAEEMEEEGINLKEMNLRLLEKVEELTLYVIELKREIDKLKSR
ncbi:hypothetical protein [Sinomicrobium sp. M5D2P9]